MSTQGTYELKFKIEEYKLIRNYDFNKEMAAFLSWVSTLNYPTNGA